METIGRTLGVGRAAKKSLGIYVLCLFGLYPGLVAKSTAGPIPEFYGIHAFDKGRLTEIAGESRELRDEFSPKVRFLVFDKNIGYASKAITLIRMTYIRNKIYQGTDIHGQRHGTVSVQKWNESSTESIPLRAKPVRGEHEMVYLVPRSELKTGAYAVKLRSKVIGMFFVNKTVLAATLAKSDYCVDLIIPPGLFGVMADFDLSGYKRIPCKKAGEAATTMSSSPTKANRSSSSTGSIGGKSPNQGQPNAQALPEFKRELSSPFEKTWTAVLRILDEENDQEETVDKAAGVVRTKPSRHGNFFMPYYVKYDIRVTSEHNDTSNVTLRVERFKRDMECRGCMNSVKLIPDTTKWRTKRMKESAEEFFSKLEAQLR
ncbi:MAG: hypothetical protein ABFS45_14985 [Pseudomonadota bacterium]